MCVFFRTLLLWFLQTPINNSRFYLRKQHFFTNDKLFSIIFLSFSSRAERIALVFYENFINFCIFTFFILFKFDILRDYKRLHLGGIRTMISCYFFFIPFFGRMHKNWNFFKNQIKFEPNFVINCHRIFETIRWFWV